MATETKTFYPTHYAGFNGSNIYNADAIIGKGSDSTTSATMTGISGTTYMYWYFDLSVIPANAVINSVVCKFKAYVGNDYYTTSADATLVLSEGDVEKSSVVSFKKSQITVYTISDGQFTRQELDQLELRLRYVSTTSQSSRRTFYFYGADLTVTYTYQSEKFMLKLGGAWHDIARVFKKVNGIWVEQTELANVIEDGVRYQNGGEIVKPITVDITASGHYSYAYAEINGIKYYSNGGSTEVNAGDVITFCVYNGGTLKIDGETVLTAASGATSTYDWTVPSGITKIEIAPLYYTVISPTYYGEVTVTTTGGGSSANLISFTINGTSYQAEEGMTWAEWVASGYNTAGFYVISSGGNAGSISNAASTKLVTSGFAQAAKSDTVIEANKSYSLVNYS